MNVFECPFSFYAKKAPKQPALTLNNEQYSYKLCHEIIESLSNTLKQNGVKEGDRVALFPTQDILIPLFFFALFRLRAIACPINTYFPLSQLSKTLDALNATFFLYSKEHITQLPPIKQIALPFSTFNLKNLSLTSSSYFLDKEDCATYLFTSGSANTPKIACHTLGNHYYSALGSNARLPLHPGNRWLLSLPLYHVGGIATLFRTFLAGATLVIPSGKPHEAKTLLQTQASHLSFVPTQLYRLLEASSLLEITKLSHQLKSILLGGATISPSLYRLAWSRGLPVYPTYGMTEMSSQICTQFEPSYFSQGHPLPYREMKITESQEILVKGQTLFLGYLNGNTLHLPLDPEGWFATGDLGSYSSKKGLQIKGRKDRLFISGGENIYPEEIENVLRQIEGIIDARVESIDDVEFGKRPIAYIQSENPFQAEVLKEYLGDFLPKYKVPVAFYARTLRSKFFH